MCVREGALVQHAASKQVQTSFNCFIVAPDQGATVPDKRKRCGHGQKNAFNKVASPVRVSKVSKRKYEPVAVAFLLAAISRRLYETIPGTRSAGSRGYGNNMISAIFRSFFVSLSTRTKRADSSSNNRWAMIQRLTPWHNTWWEVGTVRRCAPLLRAPGGVFVVCDVLARVISAHCRKGSVFILSSVTC